MKKRSKFLIITLILFAIMALLGCAEQVDIIESTGERIYGFWFGLWHGIIAPISFFGSVFSDDIAMYAVNNTGGWYDFGFVLGAGILGRITAGK